VLTAVISVVLEKVKLVILLDFVSGGISDLIASHCDVEVPSELLDPGIVRT